MLFYLSMPPETSHILNLGWHFFVRDFKVRYRRTLFGFLWSWVPVLSVGAAITAIGAKTEADEGPLPYAAQVFLSLIFLQAFFDGMSLLQQMARRSRILVNRVPFAQAALPAAAAIHAALNFLMRLPILAALFLIYSLPTHAGAAAAALVCVPLLIAAGIGVGAWLTPASLMLHDVRYAMPFFQGLFVLVTPVFFKPSPHRLLEAVYLANPLTHLINGARDWTVQGRSGEVLAISIFAPGILLFCALSVRVYARTMKGLAGRI